MREYLLVFLVAASVTYLLTVIAREIALREGAKAIVTGSVANMAGAFTVTANLVSSERGEVLAAIYPDEPGPVGDATAPWKFELSSFV